MDPYLPPGERACGRPYATRQLGNPCLPFSHYPAPGPRGSPRPPARRARPPVVHPPDAPAGCAPAGCPIRGSPAPERRGWSCAGIARRTPNGFTLQRIPARARPARVSALVVADYEQGDRGASTCNRPSRRPATAFSCRAVRRQGSTTSTSWQIRRARKSPISRCPVGPGQEPRPAGGRGGAPLHGVAGERLGRPGKAGEARQSAVAASTLRPAKLIVGSAIWPHGARAVIISRYSRADEYRIEQPLAPTTRATSASGISSPA